MSIIMIPKKPQKNLKNFQILKINIKNKATIKCSYKYEFQFIHILQVFSFTFPHLPTLLLIKLNIFLIIIAHAL